MIEKCRKVCNKSRRKRKLEHQDKFYGSIKAKPDKISTMKGLEFIKITSFKSKTCPDKISTFPTKTSYQRTVYKLIMLNM